MKRFLALLGFLLVTFTVVVAQGNGNGNGNSGNNNTTTTSSSNGNFWANYNLPPVVVDWLQNGGPMPMYVVGKVLGAAKVWGMQNFGLSLGQMLQMYNAGKLTIVLVPTSPPTLTFLVSYGGGSVLVIDSF